jgi:ATP-dependent protease ClpP protease subunit
VKISKKTILATAFLALLAVIPAIKAAASKPKDTVVLSKDSVISINEEVNAASVAKWSLKARELDQINTNRPIILVMYTPGGDISAGTDFVEMLKGLRRPVITVTMFAASMGFQIVQNAGERLIFKTGVLMSHRARGEMSGEFGGTAPSQMDSRYAFWLSRINEFDQVTVDRTKGKQTLLSYQKSYANEMWRSGESSVAEGYADKVVVASCDNTLSGTTNQKGEFLGVAINYKISDCPLITGPLEVSVDVPSNKGPVTETEFLARGGQFDAYCMQRADENKLCSLDTSLSIQKLNEIKQLFRSGMNSKAHKVIYMTIPSGY